MSDDRELDGRADALFRAARKEQPPAGAKDFVLAAILEAAEEPSRSNVHEAPGGIRVQRRAAARKRSRSAVVWAVCAGTLAAAAGLVVVFGPERDGTITPSPERLLDVPNTRKTPPATSATSTSTPELRPMPSNSAPRARRESAAPLTLTEEVALLDRARTALGSRNAASALEILDGYERRPNARLRDEATLLRIEALAGSGRGSEASELAAQFVAQNPGSTLAERARTYLDSKKPEVDEP